MTDIFVSINYHLPRLNTNHKVITLKDEMPHQCVRSVFTTLYVLERVQVNKASGPDNNPEWALRNHANVVAPPLTVTFNKSLREGVLLLEWKITKAIHLPKTTSPVSKLLSPIH